MGDGEGDGGKYTSELFKSTLDSRRPFVSPRDVGMKNFRQEYFIFLFKRIFCLIYYPGKWISNRVFGLEKKREAIREAKHQEALAFARKSMQAIAEEIDREEAKKLAKEQDWANRTPEERAIDYSKLPPI